MSDLDFDTLSQEDIPKEKLESYAKMIEALSNKPTERDLREIEAKKFDELLEVLDAYITEYKIEVLTKFFKQVGKLKEGYHEKFMKLADKIITYETEEQEAEHEWIEYLLATSNDS